MTPFYIKAPEYRPLYANGYPRIFLAGSISGVETHWQDYMAEKLKSKFNVFNPRRDDFDVTNPLVEEQQIEWEHIHLEQSNVISFWFSKETVAPITLFELGKYCRNSSKKIFIGSDPEYPRFRDVKIQMKLIGYSDKISTDLDSLIDHIISGTFN